MSQAVFSDLKKKMGKYFLFQFFPGCYQQFKETNWTKIFFFSSSQVVISRRFKALHWEEGHRLLVSFFPNIFYLFFSPFFISNLLWSWCQNLSRKSPLDIILQSLILFATVWNVFEMFLQTSSPYPRCTKRTNDLWWPSIQPIHLN